MIEQYYHFFVDAWRFFRERLKEQECLGSINFEKVVRECTALNDKYPGILTEEILCGLVNGLEKIRKNNDTENSKKEMKK